MANNNNPMTESAQNQFCNRGSKKPPCSPLMEPMITEGMLASDENCTLSKFFSGYFLAVTMALVVLLIFLWFSWGRNKHKKELHELITKAVTQAVNDALAPH